MKTICVVIKHVWKSEDGTTHYGTIAHKVDTDCPIDALKQVVDWIMEDTESSFAEQVRKAESFTVSVQEV